MEILRCRCCGTVSPDTIMDSETGAYLCKACHSDEFEPVRKCPICEQYKDDDEYPILSDVCEDCIEKYSTVDNIIRYIADNGKEAEFFCEFLYDTKTENSKLVALCKQSWTANIDDLTEYISEELDGFGEWLINNKEELK